MLEPCFSQLTSSAQHYSICHKARVKSDHFDFQFLKYFDISWNKNPALLMVHLERLPMCCYKIKWSQIVTTALHVILNICFEYLSTIASCSTQLDLLPKMSEDCFLNSCLLLSSNWNVACGCRSLPVNISAQNAVSICAGRHIWGDCVTQAEEV